MSYHSSNSHLDRDGQLPGEADHGQAQSRGRVQRRALRRLKHAGMAHRDGGVPFVDDLLDHDICIALKCAVIIVVLM